MFGKRSCGDRNDRVLWLIKVTERLNETLDPATIAKAWHGLSNSPVHVLKIALDIQLSGLMPN